MADREDDRDDAAEDAELPLIPRAPRLPAPDPDDEPTYSLRPTSLAPPAESTYSLRPPAAPTTSREEGGYSLRPPPVGPAPTAAPEGYSLRPPRPATTKPSLPPTKPGGSVRPARASGRPPRRRSGDRASPWGRRVAFLVALVFAIIGLVPLAAALLVRTPFVQRWASERATEAIEAELGTTATFRAEATLWPLSVKLRDLEVESDDGGEPFLMVDEATVSPRLFSLIAGRLDAGEVEVVGVRARVVVKDGELVNFKPTLPESDDTPSEPKAPFRSLSVTDAAIDLTVDDVRTKVAEVDVDLAFAEGLAFDAAVRASRGTLTWKHEDRVYGERVAYTEDRLCGLEVRASFDPKGNLFTIRRLDVRGSVDFDPAPGTRPSCDLEEGDWRAISAELANLEVPLTLADGKGLGLVRGRANVKVPLGLVHRFVRFPHTTGSVELELAAERAAFEELPRLEGRVRVAGLGLDGKIFSDRAELKARLDGQTIIADDITARWGDGDFRIQRATVDLADPKIRLMATEIEADGVELQGLLRDLGAHPQSHVGWRIDHVSFDSFGGTLNPVDLEGLLVAETSQFGVYDRPSHKPDKRRMISVDRGNVTGTLAVRMDATYLERMHLVTPSSNIFTTVKLGYMGEFGLDIGRGSTVDLGEITPLVSVPIGGVVDIEARGIGTYEFPRIEGDFTVASFMLGGYAAGDIKKAHAVFVPLNLELTGVELAKNESVISSPKARIDFDGGADVLVDAEVDTRAPPSLAIRDFFEVFHFADDPRFEGISGIAAGTAKVHYAVGGAEDECGTGSLAVKAQTDVISPVLFGETFDRGTLSVDFLWDDSEAGGDSMRILLPSIAMFDGPGSVIGEATVQDGRVRGSLFGSGLAIESIEGAGRMGNLLDGEVSFIAELSGTLARLAANIDVSLSPLRFGSRRLPGSRFSIAMTPDPMPPTYTGRRTGCNRPISKPFDRAEYDKDLQDGAFELDGSLFGGQVQLKDLVISKQRAKVVKGQIGLEELDIGTLAAIHPAVALAGRTPTARLKGLVDVKRLELENLASADVSATLESLSVSEGGRTVRLASTAGPIRLADRLLEVPSLGFVLGDARSETTLAFSVGGTIASPLGPNPATVDAKLEMTPFDLAKLKDDLPQVDRIQGTASGGLSVVGELGAPKLSGSLKLRDGSLAVVGFPTTIEDVAVDVALGDGELRITKARASVGAGTLDIAGRIPIEGLGLGTGSATITGRGIKLPAGDGIDVVVDTDLDLTIPATQRAGTVLPDLRGEVEVTSFAYTRPISLSGYIDNLTKNLGRNEAATAVDPDGDYLTFNLVIDSQQPLRVENELAEIQLEFVDPGITLSGTNQRYGARGALRVLPDSKLRLRNHEFDVSEGFVRFDDPAEIRADIDVRASTELRRYAQTEATTTADGSSAAGQWDVKIHAHGTTDELKLDLTSEPALAQEDILLLLTIGMTRAEVDRGLASSLDTLGLEALSTLSGADKAVQSVIPIIDYFHFGSTYSSRTGRIEPTVTIGKRLTDDLRANVTTTLTEQDVAATLEWRLRKGVSVEASYDNTNDIGTIIGNLGLDLRWRLEFE